MLADVNPRPQPVAPRCGFGICRRPAEHKVLAQGDDGTLRAVLDVCSWHVEPAVSWGRPAPLEVAIRPI